MNHNSPILSRTLTAPARAALGSARMLSPPAIAAIGSVRVQNVLAWIGSGELRAVNLARDPKGQRPRWRISIEDWEAFKQRRAAGGRPTPATRRRRRASPAITEYF
jgi:hypothetical protein